MAVPLPLRRKAEDAFARRVPRPLTPGRAVETGRSEGPASGRDRSLHADEPARAEAIERAKAAAEKTTNFANVARDWYVLQMDGGRWEPKFALRIWHRIETHLIPELGETDIADVTVQDVLGTLRKMEEAV